MSRTRWFSCIAPIALTVMVCTAPREWTTVLSGQQAEPQAFTRAEMHRQAGELEQARDLYVEAIREAPDFAPGYRFLGETLLRLGESREAVRILEEGVRRFGDRVELLLLLGVAYGPEGRLADSVRVLKRLVELEPERSLAWANLGVSLEQMGEPLDARKAFERAVALDPSSLFAHNRLGRLLLMTGDVAAARKHLERSLELDARSTDARYYLSQVLRAEGRPAEADRLFREAFGLPAPTAPVSPEILARGKALTRIHCTSCHAEPRPETLPKRMWPFISAWMGNYLGFRNVSEPFANLVIRTRIPESPLIGREDFHAIHRYLENAAPSEPPAPEKPPISNGMPWFRVSALTSDQTGANWITMVAIDSTTRRLFIGSAYPSGLAIFDRNRVLLRQVPLTSEPIAIQSRNGGFDLTLIGDLDVDRRKGSVLRFEDDGKTFTTRTAVGDYFRTSHSRFADLTGDGREDLVVCGFGEFDRGRLAWFESLDGGGYREHVLLERSGALRVEVDDFTRDGRQDLLVLFAQARQELILFENRGDGRFETRTVLEQFPGFGYNDFLMADFNRDGHPDLVTVNGNNMEYDDPPLRPYHGIRVYLNDGRLHFTEKYFYPMFGALRAVAGDFTGDARLDLAAVSYYPDWSAEQPESFVLLAQQDDLRFQPHTLEQARWGRWLALDAGDLTGDGRLDLVLGNAPQARGVPPARRAIFQDKSRDVPPVLILEQRPLRDGGGREPEPPRALSPRVFD